MKSLSILTTLFSLIFGFTTKAQDPGAGFENWVTSTHHFLGKGWLQTKVSRSSEAASGKYSARFETFQGLLQYGQYDANLAPFIPLPIQGRADSIIFYFKGGRVSVSVYIYNKNNDFICAENFDTVANSNWSRYAKPLNWLGSDTNDLKMYLRFVANEAWLDDIILKNSKGVVFTENFETWTEKLCELPKGYDFYACDGKNIPEKSNESNFGNYALRFRNTVDSKRVVATGLMTQFPLLGKPEKVSFYLKLGTSSSLRDTFSLSIVLWDSLNEAVGSIGGSLSNYGSSFYKFASFPISYFGSNKPVRAMYIIYNAHTLSREYTDSASAYFYLDDLILDKQFGATSKELREGLIQIYPNPVDDVLTLHFGLNNLMESLEASYSIFDQQGQLISEGIIHKNASTINTSSLANGTYLVRVKSTSGQIARLIEVLH